MTCTCGKVYLNNEREEVGLMNWNPDCVKHGVDTDYWKDDERVQRRAAAAIRLRKLQAEASRRRAGGEKDTKFFEKLDKIDQQEEE